MNQVVKISRFKLVGNMKQVQDKQRENDRKGKDLKRKRKRLLQGCIGGVGMTGLLPSLGER